MHKIKRQTKLGQSKSIIKVVRYQIDMVNGSPVFRQKGFSGMKMDVSDEGNALPAHGIDFAAQGPLLWIKTRPR
ncbi:DUF1659 domain-containing protein [Desulfosporosinus fructosivorans]|uniref:DUF1659 domain-containing protein n=1 Tax=Desulfosporosinus fructosivorans TaxID=2018669 RepID=UPI0018EE8832|nr:DUF1659 domain-containing protein [Desulfosporosinus fructosivorans]